MQIPQKVIYFCH